MFTIHRTICVRTLYYLVRIMFQNVISHISYVRNDCFPLCWHDYDPITHNLTLTAGPGMSLLPIWYSIFEGR